MLDGVIHYAYTYPRAPLGLSILFTRMVSVILSACRRAPCIMARVRAWCVSVPAAHGAGLHHPARGRMADYVAVSGEQAAAVCAWAANLVWSILLTTWVPRMRELAWCVLCLLTRPPLASERAPLSWDLADFICMGIVFTKCVLRFCVVNDGRCLLDLADLTG